jgi:hypothetical protein
MVKSENELRCPPTIIILLNHLSVGKKNKKQIAYNVKVLCAVGDFENGTFNLPQKPIRSRNLNKPPQPLLHKTRVISWLRIINDKLKLK